MDCKTPGFYNESLVELTANSTVGAETLKEVRSIDIAGTKTLKEVQHIRRSQTGLYNTYSPQIKMLFSTEANLAMLTDEKQDEIIKWMSRTDVTTNQNSARDKHEPKSGEWFLEGREYSLWKETPGSFLWLHGKAGCGKTILWYALRSIHNDAD